MLDAIEQFRAALLAAGIEPPKNMVADGKLHRFSTNGKRKDDAGWYVLHLDGVPAGAFSATGALTSMRHRAPRQKRP